MPKHKQKQSVSKSSQRSTRSSAAISGRRTAGVRRDVHTKRGVHGHWFAAGALVATPLRRRLVAGAALAMVVMASAGWLAVDAQSPDGAGVAVAGQAGRVAAKASLSPNGADTKHDGGSAGKPAAKDAQTKAATNSKTTNKTTAENGKQSDKTSATSGTTKPGAAGAATGTAGAQPAPAPAPLPAPQPSPAAPYFGSHDDIITTIFWIGEPADASNAHISNAESAWDGNWQTHFGGFDDPDHRDGYNPVGFTPHENPFYFALPYNDLDARGRRKATASACPNTGNSVSWCKNAWIKVSKGGKTAYAQWQDVGPLQEDDYAYVFGTAKPKNTWGARAGLDVSPAMRDYLGLQDVDRTSWSFVPAGSVPAGPWKSVVTTSAGGW